MRNVVGAVAVGLLLVGGSSFGTAALVTHGFAETTPVDNQSANADQANLTYPGGTVPAVGGSANAPDWARVAEAVRDAVLSITATTQAGESQGAGVVFDAVGGYVLTNYHVIARAQSINVSLPDGRIVDAEVVGTDPATDLAVLRLATIPDGLTQAAIGDSDAVRVGDPVMAVGNPLGYDNTVTTGVVSAVHRPVTTSETGTTSDQVVTNAIQMDAAINPGNSGGPLFNAAGEVVGINSSIASLSAGGSSQAGSIGLGFAIPSNLASLIADQLIEKGSADHAFLGVSLRDGTATADGVTRKGAEVAAVTDRTPAAQAGLQVGDVITAIDSEPTTSTTSLTAWVRSHAVGDTVKLTAVRDGKTIEITATLVAAPDKASTRPDSQSVPDDLPTQPGGQSGQDGPQIIPDDQVPGLTNPFGLPERPDSKS